MLHLKVALLKNIVAYKKKFKTHFLKASHVTEGEENRYVNSYVMTK